MTSGSFFADDPIGGTDSAADKLGRDTYARHLVTLLERIRCQSESSVLAVIGPWGSGKSSVLSMTLRELASSKDWRLAEFNPWAYSGLEAMLFGFFSELSAALPEERRPDDTRKRIGAFVERISPFGKLAGAVGIDAQDTIGALGKWVAGDVSVSAERRKLEMALRTSKQPILVVLDDLDRLAPAELLLVFKLVRFLGRLPFVYYLLAYDERTLLDVLALTELCGGSPSRARDYLEKMVQVRLDIPPMRRTESTRLLAEGLEGLAKDLGLSIGPDLKLRFWPAYESYLYLHLSTPRAINRYLAQVDAFYCMVSAEVDFVDFALLTFTRTFEPAVYAAVFRMRSELAVERAGFGGSEDEGNLERWRDIIDLAMNAPPESELKGLLTVLGQMFLPIAAALGVTISRGDADVVAERKGVGHLDYFDRYFVFGVPGDDLSDAELAGLITSLSTEGASRPGSRRLALYLLTDTERTLRKISMRRPRDIGATQGILQLLGEVFGNLSDESKGTRRSERRAVESLASTLLVENMSVVGSMLAAIGESLGALLLTTRLLSSSPLEGKASETAANSRRVASYCEYFVDVAFSEVPGDVKNLVFAWAVADGDACRRWLRATVESRSWDPLDVAGWTITTTSDSSSARLLHEFQEEQAERLLGLDYLIDRFGSELDRVADGSALNLIDSLENRRTASLHSLRLIRDGRSMLQERGVRP